MLKITFKYKDAYTRGNWSTQTCVVETMEQCIKFYGLDKSDVEYEITSVEEV